MLISGLLLLQCEILQVDSFFQENNQDRLSPGERIESWRKICTLIPQIESFRQFSPQVEPS